MLTADFEAQVLTGHVDVTVEGQSASSTVILLDVKDLVVEKVLSSGGAELSWEVRFE